MEVELVIKRLRVLLRRCRDLTALQVDLAEDFFSIATLATAVQSIRTLEKIDFGMVGREAMVAIESMKSPISSIMLAFDPDLRDDNEFNINNRIFVDVAFDPITACQSAKEHLTYLQVTEPYQFYPVDNIQYTQLRHLEIIDFPVTSRSELLNSYLLAACFPNLRELSWIFQDPLDVDAQSASVIREWNIENISLIMETFPLQLVSSAISSTAVTHLWLRVSLAECANKSGISVQKLLTQVLGNLKKLPLVFLVIELDYPNPGKLEAVLRDLRMSFGIAGGSTIFDQPLLQDHMDVALAELNVESKATPRSC
ncbi:hypothetical protein EIP91_007820 [Steccherinum ochraceum]|uniref:Uncharacterized protein n=1 Tax=Steccherinum ochraceum TaxID=92696 RepID=A0A4R0R3S0_9APHY|nr:hypothetical protein EIP91_007820 [Steccherinum ochraceum]